MGVDGARVLLCGGKVSERQGKFCRMIWAVMTTVLYCERRIDEVSSGREGASARGARQSKKKHCDRTGLKAWRLVGVAVKVGTYLAVPDEY